MTSSSRLAVEEPALSNPFSPLLSRWQALSRPSREILTLTICLGFGLFAMPWIIWMTGQAALGPYAHGGAGRFFADFYSGLSHGEILFWIVALGPCIFVLLLRLLWMANRLYR